ncbi:hypothetical protein EV690_0616 [Celerinatantimonas diazotrophica]|uniref:Uncharacterized protein n=1 Tax=Celerinatantimonas diazotrophica TaxID=412034 RepID=A0A4R1K702_9GAMM|nr:hypothetical protein EV690_0616 [Celerinatantimonas diazotrophica]CAG9295530.1 hypothetical protein CEDIAZO_00646 [Celerinatantimonas diazotrophica]
MPLFYASYLDSALDFISLGDTDPLARLFHVTIFKAPELDRSLLQ